MPGAEQMLDGLGGVNELAGAGDHHDTPHLLGERIQRARYLERQLRNAIAVQRQWHCLEHDVAGSAESRRVSHAQRGDERTVGRLRLGAAMETIRQVGEADLLVVSPDAPDARHLAFGNGDGEGGGVAVFDRGRTRRAAAPSAETALAAAATLRTLDHLLLDARRPDYLAADAHTAVNARDRRAFGRRGDVQVRHARAVHRFGLAGSAEQRLIDIRAGERAELRADHGARQRSAEHREASGQQGAADGGAGYGESERCHQRMVPGNANAPAR